MFETISARLASLAGLLALLVLTAGCDFSRSDVPLATLDQVEAAFGPQAPGTGWVREGDNYQSGGYEVTATYVIDGPTGLEFLRIDLKNAEESLQIVLRFNAADLDMIYSGGDFSVLVLYGTSSGAGTRGRGNARLRWDSQNNVTAHFAADLNITPLIPMFRRLAGSVNATIAPPE